MAQDEYFSFGDEDLDDVEAVGHEDADLAPESPAVALADPPEADLDELDGLTSPAKRAARSRGDSERASSEKRRLSSRGTHLLAVLALAVLALVVVRVTITTIGPTDPTAPSHGVVSGSEELAGKKEPNAAAVASKQLRAGRERAVERQQIRERRAKTWQRARRGRDRRAAKRKQAAEREHRRQKGEEANAVSEPAPTEYLPPVPEVAPESAPESETGPSPSSPNGEAGLQDGARSPEFGL